MKNYLQEGEKIDYVNATGADIAVGDVVVVGSRVGVAAVNIANGATGVVELEGVFSLPKATGAAWSQGDKLFWDKTNLVFTKTASSDADLLAGSAFAAAASGDASGAVALNEGGAFNKAASVAALGTTSNIPAASCAGGSGPTATNVNGAIDAVTVAVEARLDAIEAKVDALIAALKAAGVMDN